MYTLEDYKNAPSGIGPLAYTWKDKPHRLVYDLCKQVQQLREALEWCEKYARFGRILAQFQKYPIWIWPSDYENCEAWEPKDG